MQDTERNLTMTTFELEKATMNFLETNPDYVKIMANRKQVNRQVFEISKEISLEYWGKNEWEFTLCCDDARYVDCTACVQKMAIYMKRMNPTFSKLPQLVAVCKGMA